MKEIVVLKQSKINLQIMTGSLKEENGQIVRVQECRQLLRKTITFLSCLSCFFAIVVIDICMTSNVVEIAKFYFNCFTSDIDP